MFECESRLNLCWVREEARSTSTSVLAGFYGITTRSRSRSCRNRLEARVEQNPPRKQKKSHQGLPGLPSNKNKPPCPKNKTEKRHCDVEHGLG